MDSIRDLGLGLEFDPSAIPTGINPSYECDFKNALGFFKLGGIKFREVGDAIEELHESVIKRWQSREDYHLKNLERLLSKLKSIVKDCIRFSDLRTGNWIKFPRTTRKQL